MKTIGLTALLCLILSVLSAQPGKFSFMEEYHTGRDSKLQFQAVDGDVNIHAKDVEQISLYFTVKQNNKILKVDRNYLQKYFIIKTEHSANKLVYSIKPTLRNNKAKWFKRVTINTEIIVPLNTQSHVKLVDGDLIIDNLKADQVLHTVDGDIIMAAIKGKVKAITVDGDIRGKDIDGVGYFDTVDGDLNLKNISGTFRLKTVDGDINLSKLSGSVKTATTDGDIRCDIIGINGACSFITTDGDVNVSVPSSSAFDLNTKGEDINYNLNGFEGVKEKKQVKGKVNGGGAPFYITTEDGDIWLNSK